ncbi:MAG: hemolysin III family protein [Cryomorphaceae bacterium]|nr:hemolysin III family protein [Flavobacteriales bacterium]
MADYAPTHEKANVITHAVGFFFGLAAMPILISAVYASPNTSMFDIIGSVAYSVGFLMVFGFSSLYHYVSNPKRKGVFKMWDHISIYYLIAGTYTPVIVAFAEGGVKQWMLITIWGLAFIGTVFKLFFTGKFRLVSTTIYLAMGWLIVAAPASFQEAIPDSLVLWIAVGGVFYTIGVLFYLVKKIPYHHAIWHVFVLGGAVSHYICIWKIFT